MRRWDCSVTDFSVYSTGILVTGREVFHMTMPTELHGYSHIVVEKNKPALYDYWRFLVCIEKMVSTGVGGVGVSNAHSGSCALSAEMRSLHKVP